MAIKNFSENNWSFSRVSYSDRWVLVSVVILLCFSVIMVYSTTAVSSVQNSGNSLVMLKQQIVGIILGIGAMLIMRRLDPQILYKLAPTMLVAMLATLVLTLIPGVGHLAGGARRWLVVGPLRFQPGEIAKLVGIIYFASYIFRQENKMHNFRAGMLMPFMIITGLSLLLLAEPDFGSTAIIVLVVLAQLTVVGRKSYLAGAGVLAAVILALLVIVSPYRFKRFTAFLDPFSDPSASGYQLIQSLIAVGSGGFYGTGLGVGKQKLYYLPAAHTDFIFAVIAEELGLIGALCLIFLFLILLHRGVVISRRLAGNTFFASLALGCTFLLVLPAFLNMAVVVGLLPTKGMVLPLVAYGGTAMVVHLAAVGILLNLSQIRLSR